MPKSFIGSRVVGPGGAEATVVVVAGAVVVVAAAAVVVVVAGAVEVVLLATAVVVEVVVAGGFVVGGPLVGVGRLVEVGGLLVVVAWWLGCPRGCRWLGAPEAPERAKEFTRAATAIITAALPAMARRRRMGIDL
jgi:hypothetical protein